VACEISAGDFRLRSFARREQARDRFLDQTRERDWSIAAAQLPRIDGKMETQVVWDARTGALRQILRQSVMNSPTRNRTH
jgi:hypothetical protein